MEKFEDYLSEADKMGISVQKCLNQDFMKKLGNKHFSFSNLKVEDIIDLLCEDKEDLSLKEICDIVGLKIIKKEHYKYKDEFEIRKSNGEITLVFDKNENQATEDMFEILSLGIIFSKLIIGEVGENIKEDDFVLRPLQVKRYK